MDFKKKILNKLLEYFCFKKQKTKKKIIITFFWRSSENNNLFTLEILKISYSIVHLLFKKSYSTSILKLFVNI